MPAMGKVATLWKRRPQRDGSALTQLVDSTLGAACSTTRVLPTAKFSSHVGSGGWEYSPSGKWGEREELTYDYECWPCGIDWRRHCIAISDDVLPSLMGDFSSSVSPATIKGRGQELTLALNTKIKTTKISSIGETGFSRKVGPAKISCYTV